MTAVHQNSHGETVTVVQNPHGETMAADQKLHVGRAKGKQKLHVGLCHRQPKATRRAGPPTAKSYMQGYITDSQKHT